MRTCSIFALASNMSDIKSVTHFEVVKSKLLIGIECERYMFSFLKKLPGSSL